MAWEIFGLVFTGLAAVLAAIFAIFVFQALFLWVGAKIAGIKEASFGKAFVAAVGITLVTVVANAVFAFASVATGGLAGLVISILIAVWVIKSVFETGWAQALVAWILSIVGFVVAIVLVGLLVTGAAFL
jgi:hypothetical protein